MHVLRLKVGFSDPPVRDLFAGEPQPRLWFWRVIRGTLQRTGYYGLKSISSMSFMFLVNIIYIVPNIGWAFARRFFLHRSSHAAPDFAQVTVSRPLFGAGSEIAIQKNAT